jgi:hypothetical protein
MKAWIIFLLLIFVFLAGCTTQSGGNSGPGVSITAVTVLPTEAEPRTPVMLQAFVKNVGGLKATNVRVELFGLTDEWTISPSRSQTINELNPADPSRGWSDGEEREVVWELTAPGKTTDMTYSGNVNVLYNYQTTVNGIVTAVTMDYYRQTAKTGGIESQPSSGGPITIKIIAPDTIISSGSVPIQITVQNTGSGKVKGDKLSLSVSGASCSRNDVTLIKGISSTGLYCTINTGPITNYKDYPITISTTYAYWIESPFSIKVLKNPVV